MSKKARSARGDLVDFDLLAIKQQLATAPVPVSVDQRRRFIDEKDGIKAKPALPSAMMMALEAAEVSESAAESEVAEVSESIEEEVALAEEVTTVAKSTKKK